MRLSGSKRKRGKRVIGRKKEMRERDLGSARGQEERDGIGAILEEVINRYESKIDLFCSSSRGREVSSRARIHLHTISHTLPPCWGRYRGGGGRLGAPIERNLREIYRLRRVCEFEISSIRIAPLVATLYGPLPPPPVSRRSRGTPRPHGEEKPRDIFRTRGRRTPKGNLGDPNDESTDD